MSVLTFCKPFCKPSFLLVEKTHVKIQDLQEAIQSLQDRGSSDLFVMFDIEHRVVAVVIPEAVAWWVDRLGLRSEESVAETGLLDALRQGQLIVHKDQPAGRVAQLAEAVMAGVVLAVESDGKPVGLYIPEFAVQVIGDASYVHEREPLLQKVKNIRAPGALVNMLELIEKTHPNFHSEGFAMVQARPYICDGRPDDGPHNINHSGPCRYHPNGKVSIRGMANP